MRLTGTFRSAFAGDPSTDKAADAGTGPAGSKGNPVVVVFSDVDMLTNAMARPEAASVSGGNLDLVLATMESLTGSVSLAVMKARGKIIRPFTALDEMERDFDRSVAPAVSEIQAEYRGRRERASGSRPKIKRRRGNPAEGGDPPEQQDHRGKDLARPGGTGRNPACEKGKTDDGLLSQFKIFIVFAGPALVL